MSDALAEAQVASVAPGDLEALRRLVRDREALHPGFQAAWLRLRDRAPSLIDGWAGVSLGLVQVNAGPACLAAFWQLCVGDIGSLPSVLEAGRAARAICRHAGARAALACLQTTPTACRLMTRRGGGTEGWWQGLERLAEAAPSLVAGLAGHVERLLGEGDGAGFADFVAAGLKATVADPARRRAVFTLADPLAEALLARRPGRPGFAETERMLNAFVAGLWGGRPRLAAIAPAAGPQRPMIASGTVLLPTVFAAQAGEMGDGRERVLYRAAAAHAVAHLTRPAVRLPLLSLKPLQRALVGLIEDARIEALAIERLPGLRLLWREWHVAQPGRTKTAASLMARLARALLDPDYEDPDGFVAKGRALFEQASGRRDDPLTSRAIGGLLGNDLGQMRLQFDANGYAVEPGYRDDNMHLWELPEAPDDALSLTVESARAAEGEDGDDAPGEGAEVPRAKPAGSDERGAVLATYPEWDAAAGVERANWTTLRDTEAVRRPRLPAGIEEARLGAEIARLVRRSVVGERVRQARREDGEMLDVDAAITAVIARRAGLPQDDRLYRDRRPRGRDLATIVILDVSQSTAASAADGRSILAAERVAVTALAEALEARGDRYALRAFASAGREDVRLIRLKDFDETLSEAAHVRIAGLTSGLSTRLGAALRHAGAEIAPMRTTRRLVLVLTDGEPSDIDTAAHELVEDARRAVAGLRLRGIDVFGLVIDPEEAGSATTIFGRHNTLAVQRLEELPARLAGVYFRLAQR